MQDNTNHDDITTTTNNNNKDGGLKKSTFTAIVHNKSRISHSSTVPSSDVQSLISGSKSPTNMTLAGAIPSPTIRHKQRLVIETNHSPSRSSMGSLDSALIGSSSPASIRSSIGSPLSSPTIGSRLVSAAQMIPHTTRHHQRSLSSQSNLSSSTSTTGNSSVDKMNMYLESSPVNQQSSVRETQVMVRSFDADGKKVLNGYVMEGLLGHGAHGKVKLCRHAETGELFAIKIIPKRTKNRCLGQLGREGSNNTLEKIYREIAILKHCTHPNITRLYEVIDDPTKEKIYMILEYVAGGELKWKDDEDDRPLLSIPEAKRVILDVVLGLEYLHYQGIIHRDIKPQNLLVTGDKQTKIGDFGVSFSAELVPDLSEEDQEMELAKTAGTPAFFAPELCMEDFEIFDKFAQKLQQPPSLSISQSQKSGGYLKSAISEDEKRLSSFTSKRVSMPPRKRGQPVGKQIDIWALGVTLYCIIYGRLPFEVNHEFELYAKIPRETVLFPTNTLRGDLSSTDPELIDLLNGLLEKDPMRRISLHQTKRHAWLRDAIPGETDEEKLQWADSTDPAVYLRLWNETDPLGKGAGYDAQGKIKVSDDEVRTAVRSGSTFKRLVQSMKKRLSKSVSGIISSGASSLRRLSTGFSNSGGSATSVNGAVTDSVSGGGVGDQSPIVGSPRTASSKGWIRRPSTALTALFRSHSAGTMGKLQQQQQQQHRSQPQIVEPNTAGSAADSGTSLTGDAAIFEEPAAAEKAFPEHNGSIIQSPLSNNSSKLFSPLMPKRSSPLIRSSSNPEEEEEQGSQPNQNTGRFYLAHSPSEDCEKEDGNNQNPLFNHNI